MYINEPSCFVGYPCHLPIYIWLLHTCRVYSTCMLVTLSHTQVHIYVEHGYHRIPHKTRWFVNVHDIHILFSCISIITSCMRILQKQVVIIWPVVCDAYVLHGHRVGEEFLINAQVFFWFFFELHVHTFRCLLNGDKKLHLKSGSANWLEYYRNMLWQDGVDALAEKQ